MADASHETTHAADDHPWRGAGFLIFPNYAAEYRQSLASSASGKKNGGHRAATCWLWPALMRTEHTSGNGGVLYHKRPCTDSCHGSPDYLGGPKKKKKKSGYRARCEPCDESLVHGNESSVRRLLSIWSTMRNCAIPCRGTVSVKLSCERSSCSLTVFQIPASVFF